MADSHCSFVDMTSGEQTGEWLSNLLPRERPRPIAVSKLKRFHGQDQPRPRAKTVGEAKTWLRVESLPQSFQVARMIAPPTSQNYKPKLRGGNKPQPRQPRENNGQSELVRPPNPFIHPGNGSETPPGSRMPRISRFPWRNPG